MEGKRKVNKKEKLSLLGKQKQIKEIVRTQRNAKYANPRKNPQKPPF